MQRKTKKGSLYLYIEPFCYICTCVRTGENTATKTFYVRYDDEAPVVYVTLGEFTDSK